MNEILKPLSSQRIVLSSGREITVAKATPSFRRWAREMPRDTFNGKPLLEFNGEMVFAVLSILRSFQQAGWDGRWIDTDARLRHPRFVGVRDDRHPKVVTRES